MEPSAASKAGKHFNGPVGEKIYAKGRRITPGVTAEGQKKRISWEVCPVKKPLGNASSTLPGLPKSHNTDQRRLPPVRKLF